MDRRNFLEAAAMLPSAFIQHSQGITHVDTVRSGPPLKSSVVKSSSLQATGDSPGAKAKTKAANVDGAVPMQDS